MSADLQALIASPWWRWKPGMAGLDPEGQRWRATLGNGGILLWEVEGDGRGYTTLGAASIGLRPDPADPATLGCLLALAREAWGDPTLHVALWLGMWHVVSCRYTSGLFDNEPAALIAAVLAAPPPGVDRG